MTGSPRTYFPESLAELIWETADTLKEAHVMLKVGMTPEELAGHMVKLGESMQAMVTSCREKGMVVPDEVLGRVVPGGLTGPE